MTRSDDILLATSGLEKVAETDTHTNPDPGASDPNGVEETVWDPTPPTEHEVDTGTTGGTEDEPVAARDPSIQPFGSDVSVDPGTEPASSGQPSDVDALTPADDAVHTFANEFLADAPADIAIIIPETDHGTDPFAPIAPVEHLSFVTADADLEPAPPQVEDLFGNDPAAG